MEKANVNARILVQKQIHEHVIKTIKKQNMNANTLATALGPVASTLATLQGVEEPLSEKLKLIFRGFPALPHQHSQDIFREHCRHRLTKSGCATDKPMDSAFQFGAQTPKETLRPILVTSQLNNPWHTSWHLLGQNAHKRSRTPGHLARCHREKSTAPSLSRMRPLRWRNPRVKRTVRRKYVS